MATFVEVHPDNPQPRTIGQAVARIREAYAQADAAADAAIAADD